MSSNRIVIKNTVILYARMLLTMIIGLWTSRLILNALGFTNQGLYNLVGGVIGLSSLITASISSSINRFITFEFGKSNFKNVNSAFQNALTVQAVLILIVIVLCETVGLWFVNTQLVIPRERVFAANIVFQLTIINVAINIFSSTPNAVIIANEKMNIFAGVAVANSLGALGIGIMLTYSNADRLIEYSALQTALNLFTCIFYYTYVNRKFRYIKFKLDFNKEFFRPIFSFAGWNSFGMSASILRGSGTNVLLNIFGGPIANTISGIAESVNRLATIFVGDFTTAYSPQITKRYAAQEYWSLISFISLCSKISYSLIAVMAIPLLFNMEPILILWLKKVPPQTTTFGQLIIIYSLIECMCRPLICAKNATGDIRNYQLVVGGILLLTLPITYIFLKLGFPIYFSYVSFIITSIGAFIARMVMLRGAIPNWSSLRFVKDIVFKCLIATAVCLVIPTAMKIMLPTTTISAIIQCIVGSAWCACCLFLIALNRNEKEAVIKMAHNLVSKIKSKSRALN